MKIFASWSGASSLAVAELLRSWLPNVIQEVEVFVSQHDIAKGSRGLQQIASELDEISFGIIVLTRQNLSAPWVQFEAGALSKHLLTSSVVPLLCNLEIADIASSPLVQFQATKPVKPDMLKLIRSINAAALNPMDVLRLEKAFERWWSDFDEAYAAINFDDGQPVHRTTDQRLDRVEAMLEAILLEMRRSSIFKAMAHGEVTGLLGSFAMPSRTAATSAPDEGESEQGGLLAGAHGIDAA